MVEPTHRYCPAGEWASNHHKVLW